MAENAVNETSHQSSILEQDSKATQSALSGLLDTDDLISAADDQSYRDISQNGRSTNRGRVSRNEFERKQLLHDFQLLKIELSQKNLVIDNMKADHISKVEELEERLNDALHNRQILQARLESALAIQQDDARSRQQQTQKELKIILERQQELELVNKRLQAKTADIQYQFQRDVQISEQEYIELKSIPADKLSLKQFFSLRIYEEMRPIRIECVNLREQRDSLSAEIAQTSHKLHSAEQGLFQESRKRTHAEAQLEMTVADLKQTREMLKSFTEKAARFDSVKTERDKLENEFLDLQKRHSLEKAERLNLQKEKRDLDGRLDDKTQAEKLLQQDKDYLRKQLNGVTSKLETTSELLTRTENQLEHAKKTREELYEKYANSRDENRLEYERRLQYELDRIRMQTDTEIGKLQNDTKESFERENRGLREARDLAVQQRDQMSKAKEDAEKRCETYLAELRTLEGGIDSRISEFRNDARTKSMELDRLQIMYEETHKNLVKAKEDCERLAKKLEVTTLDYTELEKRSSVTETGLRSTVRELEARLVSYERMEKELDDVVMQAAEVAENDETAEQVLFSYGYGANIPTNAKLRMKQSVHLARRILKLEKLNSSLHAEIQRKEEELKKVSGQLSSTKELLDHCNQPYSYLIEGMQNREEEVRTLKKSVCKLEKVVEEREAENKHLLEVRKTMTMDLDRLLSHRQEMAVMKEVVKSLASQKLSDGDKYRLVSLDSRDPSASDPGVKKQRKLTVEQLTGSAPTPVVFTKGKNLKFSPRSFNTGAVKSNG